MAFCKGNRLRLVEKKIDAVELEFGRMQKNRELLELMKLQKSLVYFTTGLRSNEAVLDKLVRTDVVKKYEEDSDLLEDVIVENKQAIEMAKTLDMNIIPYEEAEGLAKSRQIIADVTAPSSARRSLGVFIGPEGGFAREEVEQAMAAGAECITLGHRILRTETAGLAVMSIIMFSADRDN